MRERTRRAGTHWSGHSQRAWNPAEGSADREGGRSAPHLKDVRKCLNSPTCSTRSWALAPPRLLPVPRPSHGHNPIPPPGDCLGLPSAGVIEDEDEGDCRWVVVWCGSWGVGAQLLGTCFFTLGSLATRWTDGDAADGLSQRAGDETSVETCAKQRETDGETYRRSHGQRDRPCRWQGTKGRPASV